MRKGPSSHPALFDSYLTVTNYPRASPIAPEAWSPIEVNTSPVTMRKATSIAQKGGGSPIGGGTTAQKMPGLSAPADGFRLGKPPPTEY